MYDQNFIHCDSSNEFLTLHDCIADRAYLRDGKLVFEFSDGFWIAPNHPDNPYEDCLRTDASKVEFALENGNTYDVSVWLFVRERLKNRKKTVRDWDIDVLIKHINSGKCKLWFVSHYSDTQAPEANLFDCILEGDGKLSFCECWMRIYATKINYYWNNLCPDRPW